jgi:hypothetical protein
VPISIGQAVPGLAIEVYNTAGVLANAGTAQATIMLDGVTLATLTPDNPATGKYQITTYIAASSGLHTVWWTLTAPNAGAQVQSFYVDSASGSVGIVSLAEVKEHLRITQNTYDNKLNDLILTASSLCESSEGTGVTWRRTVVTNEVHTASGAFVVHRRPISSLTAITVDGVTANVADFDFDADTGWVTPYATTLTSTRERNVAISYVAGGGRSPGPSAAGCWSSSAISTASTAAGPACPGRPNRTTPRGAGYLVPNRVAQAWQSYSGTGSDG